VSTPLLTFLDVELRANVVMRFGTQSWQPKQRAAILQPQAAKDSRPGQPLYRRLWESAHIRRTRYRLCLWRRPSLSPLSQTVCS